MGRLKTRSFKANLKELDKIYRKVKPHAEKGHTIDAQWLDQFVGQVRCRTCGVDLIEASRGAFLLWLDYMVFVGGHFVDLRVVH